MEVDRLKWQISSWFLYLTFSLIFGINKKRNEEALSKSMEPGVKPHFLKRILLKEEEAQNPDRLPASGTRGWYVISLDATENATSGNDGNPFPCIRWNMSPSDRKPTIGSLVLWIKGVNHLTMDNTKALLTNMLNLTFVNFSGEKASVWSIGEFRVLVVLYIMFGNFFLPFSFPFHMYPSLGNRFFFSFLVTSILRLDCAQF